MLTEQCLARDIRGRRSALVPTAGMLAAAPVLPFPAVNCSVDDAAAAAAIILVAAPAPG